MARRLDAPTLTGQLVRLEPVSLEHIDDLVEASSQDRSTYDWTTVPRGRESVEEYVQWLFDRSEAGEYVPFTQVSVADGRAIGMTNYLSIRWEQTADLPYAVEVGGTWLAHSAQRTGINVEAKLLLFTQAFDVWGVGRVDLKTDARNAPLACRDRRRRGAVRSGVAELAAVTRPRRAGPAA